MSGSFSRATITPSSIYETLHELDYIPFAKSSRTLVKQIGRAANPIHSNANEDHESMELEDDARVPGMGELDDDDPSRLREFGALKSADGNVSPCTRTDLPSPAVLSQNSSIIPSAAYDPGFSAALPQIYNYAPVPSHISANQQRQQPKYQYAAGPGIQVGTGLQHQQHQHPQSLQQGQGSLHRQEKAEIVLEIPPLQLKSRKTQKLRGSSSLNEKYARMKHDMSLMTSSASYRPLPRIARSGENQMYGGVPTSLIFHGPILDPIHQDTSTFGYQGLGPMNNAIYRTETPPMSANMDTVGYRSNHATSDVLHDLQLFELQVGVDMIPSLAASTGTESASGFADLHQTQPKHKRMRIANGVSPVPFGSSAAPANDVHGMDAVHSGAYSTPHFRRCISSSSRTTRPNPVASSTLTQYIPYSAPRRQILDDNVFNDGSASELGLSEQGLSIQGPAVLAPSSFIASESSLPCPQARHGSSMPLRDDILTWSPKYERFNQVDYVDPLPSPPQQYPEQQAEPSSGPVSVVSYISNPEDVLDARAMTIRERIHLMGSRMRTCAAARINRCRPDPLPLPSLGHPFTPNGIKNGYDNQEREWKRRQIYRFESPSRTGTSKHKLIPASLWQHEQETKMRAQDDCAATACFAEIQNLLQPLAQSPSKERRGQSPGGMSPTQEVIAIERGAMSPDAVSCDNPPQPRHSEDYVRNEITDTNSVLTEHVVL